MRRCRHHFRRAGHNSRLRKKTGWIELVGFGRMVCLTTVWMGRGDIRCLMVQLITGWFETVWNISWFFPLTLGCLADLHIYFSEWWFNQPDYDESPWLLVAQGPGTKMSSTDRIVVSVSSGWFCRCDCPSSQYVLLYGLVHHMEPSLAIVNHYSPSLFLPAAKTTTIIILDEAVVDGACCSPFAPPIDSDFKGSCLIFSMGIMIKFGWQGSINQARET